MEYEYADSIVGRPQLRLCQRCIRPHFCANIRY